MTEDEWKDKRSKDTFYLLLEGGEINELLFEIINASTEEYRQLQIQYLKDYINRLEKKQNDH